nr:FAD-dependent oxidoreductase [Oscillospiraceae bacterium]
MNSIWHDIQLPHFPALEGNLKTDVLIIGGGMAGLLCAHCLTLAGISCIVAEADTIAGGITQNTTAKITAQHGLIYHKLAARFGIETAGLYLEANENALRTLRELCSNVDCDFSHQDNHIYSRSDQAVLEEELNTLQALGYPAGYTETLPLPFPTAGAVTFPRQGQFHPLKFLAAIAPALDIFEHTRVRELVKNTAITDSGTITAETILVATHFPFLNKHGSYFLKLYQQRSYVLSLENVPAMEGMYLDQAENGLSFRSHNGTLLLGGGGHRTGKQGGNWHELEAFAQVHYPGAKITHRWAAQDCMSLDGIPYIGRYSARTQNLYVATGFNKWGMTSSMVAAQLLTDLIQGKQSPYAEVFSPSRSILHPQLGLNALESTKNLLSLSAKRCPHLGCALKWNPQEHSWDCPCHGSRFTADGTLIDNPATGNLKKRE